MATHGFVMFCFKNNEGRNRCKERKRKRRGKEKRTERGKIKERGKDEEAVPLIQEEER